MKQSNHTMTSGLRGLFCAGLSTVITAFFSWSFVASTDTLDWMGSSTLHLPEMVLNLESTGSKSGSRPG